MADDKSIEREIRELVEGERRAEFGAVKPGITTNIERPPAPQGSGGTGGGDNNPTAQRK